MPGSASQSNASGTIAMPQGSSDVIGRRVPRFVVMRRWTSTYSARAPSPPDSYLGLLSLVAGS